mgnify:CR=1 FL=1
MAGLFGFLDFTKEGPGIKKDGPKKKALFVFFETYFRNFWRFILINLVYCCLSLPLVTNGMAAAGLTNVTRNIARDKHSFGLSDFFETIRKNLKQSIIVGVINAIVTAILAFSLYSYYNSYIGMEEFNLFYLVGLSMSMLFTVLFAIMQFYIYTLMITFDFSTKALYINSFKFVFVNLWRNLLCGILLLATYGVYVGVFVASLYVADGQYIFAVLLIELIIALLTLPAFQFLMIQFFTFGSIKKYIIDPYYAEHPDADIEKRRNLGLDVPDDNEYDDMSWE